MNTNMSCSPSFGWNIRTHLAATEHAVKDNDNLSSTEKRMLARCSQMPDLDQREVVDMISPHFYDVLHEDPSFGTKNDARNNAMSRFLHFTKKAQKETNRENFLRQLGYAVHYLQDAATPPHTEHGNYFHKLFRIPMHTMFERGKCIGASSRLDILSQNFTKEDLPFSTLKMLFHNNALFSVQPENHVNYFNISKWPAIQQRCYDRSVNSTRVFLDYMLQFLPKK